MSLSFSLEITNLYSQPISNHPGVICKAAFALLAVTANFFPEELYNRRGGKKEVKEHYDAYVEFIPGLILVMLQAKFDCAGLGNAWRWKASWPSSAYGQHYVPDRASQDPPKK